MIPAYVFWGYHEESGGAHLRFLRYYIISFVHKKCTARSRAFFILLVSESVALNVRGVKDLVSLVASPATAEELVVNFLNHGVLV